nr:hypothetical protein [uncultured Desulfobacter sp.]
MVAPEAGLELQGPQDREQRDVLAEINTVMEGVGQPLPDAIRALEMQVRDIKASIA